MTIGYISAVLDYYCETCCPEKIVASKETTALFACGSETDSWSECCRCGELIPEPLTSDGIAYHVDSLREYLVSRHGNTQWLNQVVEALKSYGLEPEERTICDIADAALTHASLTAKLS